MFVHNWELGFIAGSHCENTGCASVVNSFVIDVDHFIVDCSYVHYVLYPISKSIASQY